MKSLKELDLALQATTPTAEQLLAIGEDVVRHWVIAHDQQPTTEQREGFRLLALHRQGARVDPSFNACRETCRELAYHYNLIETESDPGNAQQQLEMMRFVAKHLLFFVGGKLEQAQLGNFCCSSKSIDRTDD